MKNRNLSIDALRILSIIFVLSNHLFYPVFSRPDFYNGASWWIALFIYSLSLVAVPIFIMVSGYLLIDREDTIQKSIKRAIEKLLIPLLFWFGFYLIWKINYRSQTFSLLDIWQYLISGNLFVYYFLVILIGLYALLPIFQLLAKHGSHRLHLYITYGSFIVTWVLGIVNYFALTPYGTSSVTWWLPFVAYFWWGFMCKKVNFKTESKKFLWLFGITYLLILLLGRLGILLHTIDFLVAYQDGIYYWHSYLSPMVSLMAVGLFTWFINNQSLGRFFDHKLVHWIIQTLAPVTYGVYLVHAFVIDVVDIRFNYAIEFVDSSLLPYVLIRPVLVIGFSLAIALVISKIKYLRKVIGLSERTTE